MCLIYERPPCSEDAQTVVILDSFPSILSPFASLKRKSLFVSSKRK